MIKKSTALTTALLIVCFHPMLARPRVEPAHTRVEIELPDLKIKQYEFVSANDKSLRVQVANDGKATSAPCRLELAIRKINGAAVTRTVYETIPALKPGKEEWITLSATGILPAAIKLKDTTFRLTADETRVVAESNEDNNETWHNPN
jgi:subtilase family serine protease